MDLNCDACEREFTLKQLAKAKGKCPVCGAAVAVSKYCAYKPERRFWRLYSAAPKSIKFATFIYALIFVIMIVNALFDDGKFDLSSGICIVRFLPAVIALGPLFAVLHGEMRVGLGFNGLCLLFVAMPALLGGYGVVAVSIALAVGVLLITLPLLVPSAWAWRRKLTDESLAYRVAKKSGEDLSSIATSDCKLKISSIVIFWIALIVIGWGHLLSVARDFNARADVTAKENQILADFRQQQQTLAEEYMRVGLDDFMSRPADFLVATNDVPKTQAMLKQSMDISKKMHDLIGTALSYEFKTYTRDKYGRTLFHPMEISSKVWELREQVFALSLKIVGHFVEWNGGDANGALKKEFGTDDKQAIWQKMIDELTEFDSLNEKIKDLLDKLKDSVPQKNEA